MSNNSTCYVECHIPAGGDDVLPPRRALPHFPTHAAAGAAGRRGINPHPHSSDSGWRGSHHPRSLTAASERSSRSSHSNGNNTVFSFRQGKRIFNREIAFVMLVVAAQTMTEIGAFGAGVLSTEVMADTYGFAERPSVDSENYQQHFCYNSYTTAMPGGKFISCVDPIDGALTPSSSNSGDRAEDEDEESPSEEEVEALSLLSASARQNQSSFLQTDELWDRVMEFLPWREVMELRRVNRLMLRRSLGFAAVMRMPHTKQPALFIPCREDLNVNEAAAEAALHSSAPSPSESWLCPHCGGLNDGNRTRCLAYWCGAERPPGGCRMFLGQLRRNGTVRMVEWLVNYVFDAPRGALVSVENHRNVSTGRGKGCAWPTIADDATVNRMLASHHRLFYDRVGGVEGVWLVAPGQEKVLQTESDDPSRGGRNHLKFMPRNLMVFELPAGQQRPAAAAVAGDRTVPHSMASQHHVNFRDFAGNGMQLYQQHGFSAAVPTAQPFDGFSFLPNQSTFMHAQAQSQFRCPAPRSVQMQQHVQQIPELGGEYTMGKALSDSRETGATTPSMLEELSHSTETIHTPTGLEAVKEEAATLLAPYFDPSTARVIVRPGVYRHHPYGSLIFQL